MPIRYILLAFLVTGMAISGVSVAADTQPIINQGGNAEQFIDDLEYETERNDPAFKGEEGGNFATPSHETALPLDTRSLASTSQRSAGDCDWVWTDKSHTWRYEGLIPNVHVRTRMWIYSKSYSGSQTDRLACLERWYFSDRITNNGTVNADANCSGCARPVMARISNHTDTNQAVLDSYRSAHSYGSAAVTPRCANSTHAFVINGQTYTYSRNSGYCAF